MTYLARVDAELARIRAEGRYRTVEEPQPPDAIDFSSNDYLGFSRDPRVVEALRRATRVGSGGARLLGGRHREHALLERELAEWLGRERALLFSSGYLAAIGSVPALASVTGRLFSDERNHASLIDAMRLSKAERTIYPHATIPARGDAGSVLLVTESLFGMDGDAADLRALRACLGDDDVLFVDEAHALGVTGAQGAGLMRELRDPRAIVMGTLSKALGGQGGFVAGPAQVIELLVNRARGFVFDTALPPAIALAARVALQLVKKADDRRERLQANAQALRDGLRALGFAVAGAAPSPIVPVVLGSEDRALALAERMRARRIVAPAIRPPTVAPGGSCLRLSVRADHTPEQIALVVAEFGRCTDIL